MKYVKIPLPIVIKASRYNRQLHKYLKLFQAGIDPEKQESEKDIDFRPEKPDTYYVTKNWKTEFDHSGDLSPEEFRFKGTKNKCELFIKKNQGKNESIDLREFYVDPAFNLELVPEHPLEDEEVLFKGTSDECKKFIEKEAPKEVKEKIAPPAKQETDLKKPYQLKGKKYSVNELRSMAKEAKIQNADLKKPEVLIEELGGGEEIV